MAGQHGCADDGGHAGRRRMCHGCAMDFRRRFDRRDPRLWDVRGRYARLTPSSAKSAALSSLWASASTSTMSLTDHERPDLSTSR